MANKHRGEVEIEIGGKTRTLRFDFNAMAELEGVLGIDGLDALQMKLHLMGYRQARAALWAGLLHESPRLTLHEVGSWVEVSGEGGYTYVVKQVCEALNLAFVGDKEPEPEEESDSGEAVAPTG